MSQSEIHSPEKFLDIALRCVDFLGDKKDITVTLFSGEHDSAEGYVNQVARVKNSVSGRSVIVKQVLSSMRRVPQANGELVLPVNRCRLEVDAFKLFNSLTPGSAPQVYGIDAENATFVMQDLAEMNLARFEFARLHEQPDLGLLIGRFLGRNAFYTSSYYLDDHQKLALQRRWSKPAFHDVYTRIFFDWVPGIWVNKNVVPEVAAALATFMEDPYIRTEIAKLRHDYVNLGESLIHSDFHTSNIFVKPGSFVVIDGEATFWGPSSYDLGVLIGNLMDSCLSLQVRPDVSEERKLEFEDYLITTVKGLFDGFNDAFIAGWCESARPMFSYSPEYLEHRITQMFQDALGYAAMISIGMAQGIGMVHEFVQLTDPKVRALAQKLTFFTGKELMYRRHEMTRAEEVCTFFKNVKQAFRYSKAALGESW